MQFNLASDSFIVPPLFGLGRGDQRSRTLYTSTDLAFLFLLKFTAMSIHIQAIFPYLFFRLSHLTDSYHDT